MSTNGAGSLQDKLRNNLLAAVGMAILTSTALALPAWAQEAAQATSERPTSFDIPAQDLNSAVLIFAQKANVRTFYDTAKLRGHRSQALSGTMSPREAIGRLLAGSGLSYRFTGPNAVTIGSPAGPASTASVPEGAISLDTINVDGENGFGAVNGIVARRSGAGSKVDTALIDTPRAVNVVTRDQIEAQGAQSITQALRYTPGVVQQYADTDSRYDWMTVRGFSPPGRFLDGLKLPFGARGYAQPRIEAFNLERVELLKGPMSGLYGQSSPGGLLNMASKLPTETARGSIELQTGSHARKQAAFDISGPLDPNGRILYRLVGLARDADTQTRFVEDNKVFIAPSLTIKPTDATTLTLLGHYQKINDAGGGAFPALPVIGTLYRYQGIGRLPTNTFTGEPTYDRFINQQWFAGYQFSHALNDSWTIRQNLRYGEVDTDSRRVQNTCLTVVSCQPTTLSRYAWAFPETARMFTADTRIEGRFATGPLNHTLIAGVDVLNEDSVYRETGLNIINLQNYNAFRPTYGLALTPPPLAMRIAQSQTQVGLYAQDQIKFDKWTATFGGRYDSVDVKTGTYTVSTARLANAKSSDRAFTGNLGLSYRFDNGIAPYAGYSTSFQPVAGTDAAGNPFKPSEGEQFEAGVKYQPLGFDGLLSLSAFQLKQSNVVTAGLNNIRTQTGEVRIRGLEFEAKANLGAGFDGLLSYAYIDSEITKSTTTTQVGKRLAFAPVHQGSAWLYYTVQGGLLSGLSAGAGVRYIGGSYGNNDNLYGVPAVALVDASLKYDLSKLNPALKGFSAQVNATNLFDKVYVSTCLSISGCYYGDRRTVYAALKYQW